MDLIDRLKEDRRLERKPAGIHAREMGTYFSMWANTSPEGGLLLLGVEDNGALSGCSKLSPKELNDREKAGWTYCPDARAESKRLPVTNRQGEEDFIIAFRIFYREDKVVADVSGEVYRRDGDSRRKLTQEEVRELQNDKGQVDLEREPVAMRYPEEFNAELIRDFSDGVRKLRQLSSGHSSEEILVHPRLGKRENGRFHPNVACALAFAMDPCEVFPGCKVRFLRFDGEREETGADYNVVKDIPIEGPVPYLIVEPQRS